MLTCLSPWGGGVLVSVLRLGGVLVQLGVPHSPVLTFLSPWGGGGGGPGACVEAGGGSWFNWGPHTHMLTFLSPWWGVLVQLGSPRTHPDLPVPNGGSWYLCWGWGDPGVPTPSS